MKLLIAIMSLTLLSCSDSKESNKPIVFMDSFKVFADFEMKKEYDSLLYLNQKDLGDELDSLARILEAYNSLNVSNPMIDKLKTKYFILQDSLNQIINSKSNEYTNKVYSRLNELVSEFGTEMGYGIILGSDGKGSVMYVDTFQNVTNQVILFINNKYNNN